MKRIHFFWFSFFIVQLVSAQQPTANTEAESNDPNVYYYRETDVHPTPVINFDLQKLSSWFNSNGENPTDFGAGKTFVLLVPDLNLGYFEETRRYVLTGDWKVDGTIKMGEHVFATPVIFLNDFTLSVNKIECSLAGSLKSNLIVTGETEIDFGFVSDYFTYINKNENPKALNNLVINTATNKKVSVKSPIEIHGELKIESGELVKSLPSYYTSAPIILKSSSLSTASVAPVTGKISLPVTVERFIPARRAWRLLCAPVDGSQTIYNSWQEGGQPSLDYGTYITGGSKGDGFDINPLGGTSSILRYMHGTNAWVPLLNTNNTMVNSEPFMLFVRGDRFFNLGSSATPPRNTVLRATGMLNTGDQTYPVYANGFTAVPNPFASPINFATITRNNVQNNFYVWDPKLGGPNGVGGYVLISYNGSGYDMTPAVSAESQFIQSGQAFLVQSTGVAGSITIKETDKAATPAANVFRSSNTFRGLRTTLQVIDGGGEASVVDETFTAYDARFSNAIDGLDPAKMANKNESLGIERNGKDLAIERRQPFITNDTIFLKLWNMQPRQYVLQFTPANMNSNGIEAAKLIDNYRKNSTTIDLSKISSVFFSVDGNAASSNAHRFMVVLNARNSPPASQITTADIKISPSPVTGSVLSIQFINQPAGVYNLVLVNSLGQMVLKHQIIHAGGTNVVPLHVRNSASKGVYQLQISNTAHNLQTILKVMRN